MSDYSVRDYIDEEDYFAWQERCRLILVDKSISSITEYDISKNLWEDGFTPEDAVEETMEYWMLEE